MFTKACRDCCESLPVENFSISRNHNDGLVPRCKACMSVRWAKHYAERRAHHIHRSAESTRLRRLRPEVRSEDRQKSRAAKRAKLQDPAEYAAHLERNRAWLAANPDRALKFRHAQPALWAHRTMVRYARKKRAIPAWADLDKIAAIYAEAARISVETGVPHEVDHIVPLAGLEACGLHVAENLRIIPALDNRRKGRKFIADLAIGIVP